MHGWSQFFTWLLDHKQCWSGFVDRSRIDEAVKKLYFRRIRKKPEIKACESRGMRRTFAYAAVTRDEA
ncbi:hypothetical protein DESC_100098 [Desulfosarcina cetonica]|nr:hypothetical protein DESC_100098 [Desulfosarcina cetonica]